MKDKLKIYKNNQDKREDFDRHITYKISFKTTEMKD